MSKKYRKTPVFVIQNFVSTFLSTEPHAGDDGMFDDYRLYFKSKKGENISRLSCKLNKKISYPLRSSWICFLIVSNLDMII